MGQGGEPLMFVPFHDNAPLRVIRFQYVTGAIIIANVAIFLLTGAFTSEATISAIAYGFGIVPAELTYTVNAPFNPIPEPFTIVTYMFLHGSWLHIISNMLFLWVFADNVEDAFGHAGFLFFYLLCGIAGGAVHTLVQPGSVVPLIGASGAVSGVLASYLLLYPRARVWILLLMRLPLRIPAWAVLGGWFILQLISLFIPTEDEMQVAWWAHIGGFLAGLLLTFVFRSRLLIRTAD
jgi:membrane associated rhomboid family serine protease